MRAYIHESDGLALNQGCKSVRYKAVVTVLSYLWHFMRYCECFFGYCPFSQGGGSDTERTKKKKRGDRYSVQTSLIVAALKKMLPIGLNMCSPADQELINLAKIRYSLVVFSDFE